MVIIDIKWYGSWTKSPTNLSLLFSIIYFNKWRMSILSIKTNERKESEKWAKVIENASIRRVKERESENKTDMYKENIYLVRKFVCVDDL